MMETQKMDDSVNVFGEPLTPCSERPLTGFFRDGCCNTSGQDRGSHTVCVEASREFLDFSRQRGNDLSTPRPEFRSRASNRATAGVCAPPAGSKPTSTARPPGSI